MRFDEFGLAPALLQNIEAMGFQEATAIQSEVIPLALEGKDVSGLSKTGTGKTAAFLIPAIQRLLNEEGGTLLCLAPTRELAIQIEAEAKKLTQGLNLGTVSVVGGMSSSDQVDSLEKGARIVIGTPGRLIDLYKEKHLDLSRVKVMVFDEADRMFDMGFIRDMRFIMSKVPVDRQILLFSATLNFTVLHMIYEYGSAPTEVNVSRDQVTADGIQQVLYQVADEEKLKALIAVCRKYASNAEGSIVVFSNYKERVQTIAAYLNANGFPAQGLSSLMRQEKRNRIIQGFRTGKFRALVATDVASRGLDIDNVVLVVNYHLPEDAATYVHRIGRTARAGKSGIAVSIPSSEDSYNQIRVEEFLGKKIPAEWLEEADFNFTFKKPDFIEEDESEEEEGGGLRQHQRFSRDRGDRGRSGRGDRGEPRNRGDRQGRGDRRDRPLREREPRDQHGGERSSERPNERALERESRYERPARPDHSGQGYERGGRSHERGSLRQGNSRSDRYQGNHRDRGGMRRPPITAPADLPSPVTGNPVIYDTRTGEAKNRSREEMDKILAAKRPLKKPSSGESPALFKKIRSRVSALFAAKK